VRRSLAGDITELCRGQVVNGFDDSPITVTLAVRAGSVTVRLGETTVVSCTVPELPRGAWGLGVVGASARLGIDTLAIER
jgi:hypothetical protein